MGTLCRERNCKVKRTRCSRKFQRIAVGRLRTCESVTELARELGQKPSPDSTRVTGYSAVHSVGENRASHELAACRQKRRPPESRPMIVDLWSAKIGRAHV